MNDKIRQKIKKIKQDQLEIKEQLDRISRWLSVRQSSCYVCTNPGAVPEMVASPCGHTGICKECAPNINLCPICRQTVNKYVRVFFV